MPPELRGTKVRAGACTFPARRGDFRYWSGISPPTIVARSSRTLGSVLAGTLSTTGGAVAIGMLSPKPMVRLEEPTVPFFTRRNLR